MSDATRRSETPAETAGQRFVASLLRLVLRATLRRAFKAGLPVERQRRRLRAITRLTLPPRGARFSPLRCGGVPGEMVVAHGVARPSASVLYLHGGGYCTGSPATHRAITGHLALRCQARVFAADYRLAPEHPFPAALEDAVAACRGLVDEGLAAGGIVIAGDSAGGGLAVATAMRLRDLGLPRPRALVLFSPWVDLGLDHVGVPPAGEVMLTLPWVRECARAYVAAGDVRDPLVSPLGGDLGALPPTLIQVGTDELLLPDSRRLFERLQSAGVRARLEEFPARWHVFQANAGVLADADRALEAVADFLRAAPH